MRNILFFAAFVLATQLQAQNLLYPLKRLGVPSLNAIGIPTPQQPQPQPSPQSRGTASPTAIVVGAAIGGLIGSNSQKTTEGAAIGGALGLLIGQMLERKAMKKAERQAALENSPPKESQVREEPQIDPATGLPIDPNSLPPPAIDPATGLPIISSTPAPVPPTTPHISPSKRVNKLFGR